MNTYTCRRGRNINKKPPTAHANRNSHSRASHRRLTVILSRDGTQQGDRTKGGQWNELMGSHLFADSVLTDLLKELSYSIRTLLASDSHFGGQARLERPRLLLDKPENLLQDGLLVVHDSGVVRVAVELRYCQN